MGDISYKNKEENLSKKERGSNSYQVWSGALWLYHESRNIIKIDQLFPWWKSLWFHEIVPW